MTVKRAAAVAAALIMLISACACTGGKKPSAVSYNGEECSLFDTSVVHRIEITLAQEDWADLTANPLKKTKYHASAVIDGERVEDISFSTKGNTSLTHVAGSGSQRFSFKLNFGKFQKGQTFHGLDKLSLNNLMADATYMKDHLSYLIMREAGVNAPLTSYAELYINGSLHGLYIAIEDVSSSFLNRTVGSSEGALYKPETERLANVDAPGGQGSMPAPPQGFDPSSAFPPQGGQSEPPHGGQGEPPQGGPGMEEESNGADLVYKDDELSSYSAIFDNEENKVGEDRERALIAAIKALNTGEDVEKYWDVDQIIRYFAAHNFVLNYDSYTGNMLHNYYLYESGGKVTVFPWDYNLAFCGFAGGDDAEAAVNTGIDSPLRGASPEQRPLWNLIASDEAYLAQYHKVYDELIKSFFESGRCGSEIKRVEKLIEKYVKTDPTAFYSVSQFRQAVDTLHSFCALRAKSIRLQLDKKLAADTSLQQAGERVKASSINVASMGTMDNGGGMPGGDMGMPPAGFPGGEMGTPSAGFPGGEMGTPPPGGPGGNGAPPQGGPGRP